MKDWKTTTAGIFMALGIILPQIAAMIDGNPATNFSIEAIIGAIVAAVGAIGLGKSAQDTTE